MFNPLRLTRKPVELVYDTDTLPMDENHLCGSQAAGVTGANLPDGSPNFYQTFKIILYLKHCQMNYLLSFLKGVVPLETFVFSILVHEVAHIIADTFSISPYQYGFPNDSLYNFIDNILEDQRVERVMMAKYPRYADYLQISLSVLKWKLSSKEVEQTAIDFDTQSLMFLTRFGVIIDGADPDLMDLAFPLIVSSTKGDRENCLVAVKAIYSYFVYKYKQSPELQAAQNANLVQVPITGDDAEKILGSGQVMNNPNQGVLQDIQDVANGLSSPEKVVGSSGPPPGDAEKDDSFYEAVVSGNGTALQELRQLFLRNKVQTVELSAYEGELNINRQNDAYLNALTGEEGLDYIVYKRVYPDIDIGVLRDTSDSTDHIEGEFATASVLVHAAVDGIPGTRTAHADFNSEAEEIMKFGDTVRKSRIYPTHGGGTMLGPALDIAFAGGVNRATGEAWPGWDWKAKEKYLFIITDGDAVDIEIAAERLNDAMRDLGVIPMIINVDPGATDAGRASYLPYATVCSLDKLPEKIMTVVLGGMYV